MTSWPANVRPMVATCPLASSPTAHTVRKKPPYRRPRCSPALSRPTYGFRARVPTAALVHTCVPHAAVKCAWHRGENISQSWQCVRPVNPSPRCSMQTLRQAAWQ
jgi:hypothetical protein